MVRCQVEITSSAFWWRDHEIDLNFLESRKLYKTLSLLLSARAGVGIPQTLLAIDLTTAVLNYLVKSWGLPVMMRMDYSALPPEKPVGGIPLLSTAAIRVASKRLYEIKAVPLFHPHFDRFSDLYSVGLMIKRDDSLATLEAVGKGFDAGDLRLGFSTPHESATLDLLNGEVRRRTYISNEAYMEQVRERASRIRALRSYTDMVNSRGILVHNLDRLPVTVATAPDCEIPKNYAPLSGTLISELLNIGRRLRLHVIELLPRSQEYVASLSYVPVHGWVLWDIFASWYKR